MGTKGKSIHRLTHNESSLLDVAISSLAPGDVLVRQGTPCMVARLDTVHTDGDLVWIINLTNGSTWGVSPTERVWPATEVKLSFQTLRRG